MEGRPVVAAAESRVGGVRAEQRDDFEFSVVLGNWPAMCLRNTCNLCVSYKRRLLFGSQVIFTRKCFSFAFV
jgi:hypothetical protein